MCHRIAPLCLALLLSAVAGADTLLVRRTVADAGTPAFRGSEAPDRAVRLDEPRIGLFAPFRVDSDAPFGTTTIVSLSNTASSTITVEVEYYLDPTDPAVPTETVDLVPLATWTRNLRDIGLTGPGMLHGWVQAFVTQGSEDLVGDYLQVDVDQAFATGDRMLGQEDFCRKAFSRFADFGGPTLLGFFFRTPGGSDPNVNPPSATLEVFTESGMAHDVVEVYTSDRVVFLPSDDLTSLSFGAIVATFGGFGGWVQADFQAEGKFSAGLNGACLELDR